MAAKNNTDSEKALISKCGDYIDNYLEALHASIELNYV